MADEKLSLEISVEEMQGFVAAVNEARKAVESLSDAASSSGLTQLQAAAEQAGAALATISTTVAPIVDTSGLEAAGKTAGEAASGMRDVGEASKEAASEVEQSGRKIESATGGISGAFANLGTAGKAAIGTVIGLFAFRGIEQAVRSLVNTLGRARDEFLEAERSTLKLGAALGSTGQFSKRALDDMARFAGEVQRLTIIQDDSVIAAAALIAQLGRLEGTALKRATQAAVELSAVLGTDLQSAATLLAKAAQGNTSALGRFGIVIDETIPKGQRFAALLTKIETQFGGTAALQAQGASGAIAQLGSAWGEFLEAVGSRVVPTALRGIRDFTAALFGAADALGTNAAAVLDAGKSYEELAHAIELASEARKGAQILEKLGPAAPALLGAHGLIRGSREREVKRLTEDVTIRARLVMSGGDVAEIKRNIELLNELVPKIVFTADRETLHRILALRADLEKSIKTGLNLETDEAVKGIQALRKLAERPLEIEASLLTKDVAENLAQIRRPVFEIEARAAPIAPKIREELDKLERDVKFELPKLDDREFLEFAAKLGADFQDAFVKGTGENLDPQELFRALKLGELFQLVEKQRTARVSISLDQGTAQAFIDEQIASPLSDAQKEARILGELLNDLLRERPDATAIEIMDAAELSEDAGALVRLRGLIEDEMDRIRQAVSDPAEMDQASRDRLIAAYEAVIAAIKRLKEEVPGVTIETERMTEAMKRAGLEAARDFEPLGAAAEDAGAQVRESITSATSVISSATGAAVDAMFGNFEAFSNKTRSLFISLVQDVIRELARIAAFKIGLSFLPGLGDFVAATANVIPRKPLPTQGESFAPQRLQPLPTQGESLEFQRLSRLEALSRAERPVVVRIERERPPIAAMQSTLVVQGAVADGASLRRQLSSGGLRQEIERQVRRAGI